MIRYFHIWQTEYSNTGKLYEIWEDDEPIGLTKDPTKANIWNTQDTPNLVTWLEQDDDYHIEHLPEDAQMRLNEAAELPLAIGN